MHFTQAAIETLTYALPEERWTSADLERRLAPLYERLKLPEGRLELMTGIRERRLWPEGTSPSEASARAGREALARTGIPTAEIDLLVHSAVSRDRLEPATAAYVHGTLGLPARTQIFDLSNACLGFLQALTVAASMIESGQIRHALITAGENGRPLVDGTISKLLQPDQTRQSIKPYFANLTVGCGAVAAVLSHREALGSPQAPAISHAVVRTDSEANKLCEGDAANVGDLVMQTDSEQLLEAGVALARRTWEAFKAQSGWDEKTPDRVVCHQVGVQHQRRLYEALGLDLEKDFSTFPFLGNVGSVSLPITLAMAREKGAIKPGMKVALLGIGSGLSCMMASFEA